jgi:hypothetical protein
MSAAMLDTAKSEIVKFIEEKITKILCGLLDRVVENNEERFSDLIITKISEHLDSPEVREQIDNEFKKFDNIIKESLEKSFSNIQGNEYINSIIEDFLKDKLTQKFNNKSTEETNAESADQSATESEAESADQSATESEAESAAQSAAESEAESAAQSAAKPANSTNLVNEPSLQQGGGKTKKRLYKQNKTKKCLYKQNITKKRLYKQTKTIKQKRRKLY